jgi:parallel beta-helix repeat protein
VPACIYRETVTITKPLTLAGQTGTELRGSDVWSGWTQNGALWLSTLSVPSFSIYQDSTRCAVNTNNRCLHAEQVFFDGNPLTYDVANTTPASGQFALSSNRQVILADNPSGHTVEVTTRQRWILAGSDGVTIQGFTMKGAANDAQTGAISNDSLSGTAYNNWVIQNNTLSDAHGDVVSLDKGTGLKLLGNQIFRGGDLGVHGNDPVGATVQGNHIYNNNTDQFDMGWEAGGLKTAGGTSNMTVDSNEFDHNTGPGMWFDIHCTGAVITNNRVHDNVEPGIFYEISSYGSIHGNAVWNNGSASSGWGWGAGILLSTSNNTEVYNNVVAGSADGISVISQNRSDSPGPVVNDYVHDNSVMMTYNSADNNEYALGWLQDYSGPLFLSGSNNHGANDNFWYNVTEDGHGRYGWNNQQLSALSQFTPTPGDASGSYLTTTQANQILSAAGMPLTP